MTVKEYLIRIEEKLDQSLIGEMKEFIPRILKNLEPLSLDKFINEGDPVLELTEFRKIFDDTLSEGLNLKLNKKGSISFIDGPFQSVIIKDSEGKNREFRVGLN